MFPKLVIVALLVLALSINVGGVCDGTACDSEQQRFLSNAENLSNLQELCQSANAYLDCAKKLIKDCGEDSYATSKLDTAQKLMNAQGCGSAGKLFVCSPLLILLLFLSRSVN
ncbi:uncharacterized protein LOC124282782 [Haliotis rubra]|uniref:uncharacterized protein LOC124282782 n=1 Tax=Haliotis rubra TaxID=36100 RepID=UPI001EE57299|nr:uncharacterized protein LOC124282782 [Haliotis rubra]